MQFAVWITLSNGTRLRYGVYDSYVDAYRISELVGGVVQCVV